MIHCPTCRKKVHDGLNSCPRCNTELDILFKIENLADIKYNQGCLCLKKEEFKKAYIMFKISYRLKAEVRTKKGLIISLAGSGDFSSAIKKIHSLSN